MFVFVWSSPLTWVRVGIALVWLVFGVVFKALDLVPRHRQIVGRVLGECWAKPVILLVAAGETFLGVWMLAGVYLWLCALVQTCALVAMNALEIRHARELLLAPRAMIAANVVLVTLGWIVALAGR